MSFEAACHDRAGPREGAGNVLGEVFVITWRMGRVFVAVLMLTGCGSSPGEKPAPPTQSGAVAATTTTAGSTTQEAADQGEMSGLRLMENAQLLEGPAATVDETFNLPSDAKMQRGWATLLDPYVK